MQPFMFILKGHGTAAGETGKILMMRTAPARGALDGRRGRAITSDYLCTFCLCTFCAVCLQGRSRAPLDALRVKYPEAGVE